MKKATFEVSNVVLDVLARSTVEKQAPIQSAIVGQIDQWALTLPPGQLDRKLYTEVNKVLEGFGGKWNRKAKAHIFESDPRAKLGLTVQTGVAVNEQQKFQSFYTPPELAQRLVSWAELAPEDRILEPSAGEGALVKACLDRGVPLANILAVEVNPVALDRLVHLGVRTLAADFLSLTPDEPPFHRGEWDRIGLGAFDRVTMNPPFHGGEDAYHVMHAFTFLRPGGILVAVISNAWVANTRAPYPTFRFFLEEYKAGEPEQVPAGTFDDTNVATTLIKLRKPD